VDFERSSVDGVPVFWTEPGDEMLAGRRSAEFPQVLSEAPPGGLARRREGGLAAFRLHAPGP